VESIQKVLDFFERDGSKLLEYVPKKYIKAYKKLYIYLMRKLEKGELPSSDNYLGDSLLAKNIYKNKYFMKDEAGNLLEEKPEELFCRVSSFIAVMENSEELQRKWAVEFYKDLYYSYFLPGGRVLAGAGDLVRLKTLANCFVSKIENDDIESIYKCAYESARTYSYGGGIGIDLSVLRPKDSIVHNASDKSTGAVSFAELFSLTTGIIGQSGRRGALMLTIDVKHPDVIDFILAKSKPNWITSQIIERLRGAFSEDELKEIEKAVRENVQVRFANMSVKVSDEFMSAVREQKRYGKKILLYKADKEAPLKSAFQGENGLHYSYGIPSKDVSRYSFVGSFRSIDELNGYLEKFSLFVDKEDFYNPDKRDVYGDYVLEIEGDDENVFVVREAGDFMLYFAERETGEVKRLVKALDIWHLFVESNYKTAEPGLIFWSRMTKYSPSNYVGYPIITTNPCGEVPLEDGGACCLGSINLSMMVKNGYTPQAELDWELLRETIFHIVRFLDNVVSWNEYLHPLEKQRKAGKETRRIGIGVMGIADMFNQLFLEYDSDKAIELFEQVMEFIANYSYQASSFLAEEKGKAPAFDYEAYKENPFYQEALWLQTKTFIKEKGLRNIALLSIAPTGTISNIAVGFRIGDKNYIGVSGGIEPIFAMYYTRRSESLSQKTFRVFHSTITAYIELNYVDKSFLDTASYEELKNFLPAPFFRTAHYIDPEKRIKIQSIAQKYIDHSISSTINLPEDIEPEVISEIYIRAWELGLKGITIYRDGSRFPVLVSPGKKTEFQRFKDKLFEIVDGDNVVAVVRGDEVIELSDGRLTTIYHYLKQEKRAPLLSKMEVRG